MAHRVGMDDQHSWRSFSFLTCSHSAYGSDMLLGMRLGVDCLIFIWTTHAAASNTQGVECRPSGE